MGLRIGAAVGRIVLLIGLARWLSPEQMGIFGLMVAAVTIGLYVVGCELSSPIGRQVAAAGTDGARKLVRQQLELHLRLYVPLLPGMALVFVFDLLPWSSWLWFYALLIAEHLATELQRSLIYMGRPVLSNALLFIRNSAWGLALLPTLWAWPHSRTLATVWQFWLAGTGLSLALSLAAIRPWASGSAVVPDAQVWRRRMMREAVPFLAAAICGRALFTADRFLLQTFSGPAAVGVYAFYFGIANAIVLAFDSGVVQLVVPRLVSAHRLADAKAFRRLSWQLVRGALLVTATGALGLAVLLGPLLRLVDRPAYANAVPTLWALVFAMSSVAFGTIPRSLLFAHGIDDKSARAHGVGLGVAIVGYLTLIPRLGHLGAAIATGLGTGTAALASWFWWRTAAGRIEPPSTPADVALESTGL
jgi:O-antigen/teichoic acid export membrane protein